MSMPADLAAEFDEDWDATALSPGEPTIERVLAGFAFDLEHEPEPFFEQVAAVQGRVGRGHPGQLRLLVSGEVLRVLPQRVSGAFELLCVTGGPPGAALVNGATGFVPGLPAELIERIGGPGDDVKRIGAAHR